MHACIKVCSMGIIPINGWKNKCTHNTQQMFPYSAVLQPFERIPSYKMTFNFKPSNYRLYQCAAIYSTYAKHSAVHGIRALSYILLPPTLSPIDMLFLQLKVMCYIWYFTLSLS